MIRAVGLACRYGERQALYPLDLTVGRGELVGLLGPNGGGKTTLLMALAGALPLTQGRVEYDGADASNLAPRQRARFAAALPQRFESAFPLPCLGLTLMGRYPYLSFFGGYTQEDHEIASSSMRETRSLELASRPLDQISGGELARVLLARALAQRTPLLLLDEASASLDVARKIEIHDLLRQKNQAGTTIISAIHDLNLAALYCSRLVFLKAGRIVEDGPVPEVFREEVLSEVYETRVAVREHPLAGVPQAYFLPGHA